MIITGRPILIKDIEKHIMFYSMWLMALSFVFLKSASHASVKCQISNMDSTFDSSVLLIL